MPCVTRAGMLRQEVAFVVIDDRGHKTRFYAAHACRAIEPGSCWHGEAHERIRDPERGAVRQ